MLKQENAKLKQMLRGMLKQENAKLKQMLRGMAQTIGHFTQNFEEPPEQPQPKVMRLVDKLEEEQTNTHPCKQ